RYLDGVLDVFDAHAIASGLVEINDDLEVPLAHDLGGNNVAGAVDRLEGGLNFLADAVDNFEVRSEDLYSDIGTHAGGQHVNAVDDRLGEDIGPAGDLQHSAE